MTGLQDGMVVGHDVGMSKSSDVVVGVTIAVAIVAGWLIENRPRSAPTGELTGLYASPLCLGADGSARAGTPTVAEAWKRSISVPLSAAQPVYISPVTIELRYSAGAAGTQHLTFLAAGGNRWRYNDDAATAAWVRQVCGTPPLTPDPSPSRGEGRGWHRATPGLP